MEIITEENQKRMNKSELKALLDSLQIDNEEFTILSSSALVLRGIFDSAGDLDIAVTQKGFEQLQQNYDMTLKDNGWYKVSEKVECTLDDMINKKEKCGDYYLQDIRDYLNFIKASNREKDKARISLVENYIKKLDSHDC